MSRQFDGDCVCGRRVWCDGTHDIPTTAPTDGGQEPQHPAPSAAQSVPTDEVREALDALCDGYFDSLTVNYAIAPAEVEARIAKYRATLEAALSRNTEHDRLMREVVEAAKSVADFRTTAAWAHALAGALDRLTDYEGRSHE